MKHKRKEIFCGIEVTCCYTKDSFHKIVSKYNKDEAENIMAESTLGYSTWLEHSDGSQMFVIGIFSEDYSVLIHEASHLVDNIQKYTGIDDGEFRAYLIQHIFNVFRW